MRNLWVACDIEGTYNSLSLSEKIEFLNNIEDYCSNEQLSEIYFSFLSTLDCSSIKDFLKYLKVILNDVKSKVNIGLQFGFDGYLINNNVETEFLNQSKGMQMAEVLKNKNYFFKNDITDLIYIDDNPNINPFLLLSHLKAENVQLERAIFIIKNDYYDIRDNFYPFEVITIKKDTDNFMLEGSKELLNPILKSLSK